MNEQFHSYVYSQKKQKLIGMKILVAECLSAPLFIIASN